MARSLRRAIPPLIASVAALIAVVAIAVCVLSADPPGSGVPPCAPAAGGELRAFGSGWPCAPAVDSCCGSGCAAVEGGRGASTKPCGG